MDQISYIPQQQRMATNNISMNKGGGMVNLVNIRDNPNDLKDLGRPQHLQTIDQIVQSVRADINNLKV